MEIVVLEFTDVFVPICPSIGEWKDNKENGQGTLTLSVPSPHAGYKYVGEFRNGKYQGQGTETYSAPHKDATYYLSCWMTMAQIDKMRSKKVIFQNLD